MKTFPRLRSAVQLAERTTAKTAIALIAALLLAPHTKIVGNDELTTFELYEIQKDWKEEDNLAGKMPEKAAEMQAALLKLWKEIEAEGPKEWWLGKTGGAIGRKGLKY